MRHFTVTGILTAANDGSRDDHFRVQQGMRRVQAVQEAAMPVGPVHHGRYRDPAVDFLSG